MAKTIFLILAASLFVQINCNRFGIIRGPWNWRYRGRHRCPIPGMKAVIDEYGFVKNCVHRCGPNRQQSYSYVYGDFCKPLPHGCFSGDCTQCLEGFHRLFDHGTNRCVLECPEGYKTEIGVCIELPHGCKDAGCTECRDGFFHLPYEMSFGLTCRRYCPAGYFENHLHNRCEKNRMKEGCADAFCYKCIDGYHKHVDHNFLNMCVKKCPDGHGPIEGRCRVIPEGCLTANCSECQDGYFHYKEAFYYQKCRRTCPIGHHPDRNHKACIPCGDDNCNSCDESPFMCNKCRKRYSLLQENEDSHQQCYTVCPDGYVRAFDYKKYMFVCEVTKKQIKTTSEPKYTKVPDTTQEKTTRFKQTTATPTTTAEQVTSKNSNMTTKGQEITTVEVTRKPYPEGCQNQECTFCNAGYYRIIGAGRSECVKSCKGAYFVFVTDCIACSDKKCSSCSKGPSKCESCKPGYVTHTQNSNEVECLEKCPVGYKPILKNGIILCEKVPNPDCMIQNCETCASHELYPFHVGCIECKAGYLLLRENFKDKCVAVCPDGFYAGVKPGTTVSACLKCGVKFCQKCIKTKKCTQCFEPFVFDKYARCTLCPSGTDYNKRTKSCKSVIKKVRGRGRWDEPESTRSSVIVRTV